MKHWSFLFSYLVAPKGAVCLFVCFSSKAMEFFFIVAFTEEFLPLFGSNPIVVVIAIGFLFYLRWIFLLVPLHEQSAPPTWDEEIVDIHLLCGFFGVQTDQISCHGEPTLSVFLDPFDDLFLELRPLALPATICTFGFRQRLYVVNLPSPVSD